MSKHIISALRQLPQLKGSTFLAAVELAHRANGHSGIAYVSYSYLASKTHQSRRTAIRQVHRLIGLGIIKCQRFWGPNKKWGVNRYQFVIRWDKPGTAHPFNGDKVSPRFPVRQEEEKYGTLDGIKRAKNRGRDWLTPGSLAWHAAGLGSTVATTIA